MIYPSWWVLRSSNRRGRSSFSREILLKHPSIDGNYDPANEPLHFKVIGAGRPLLVLHGLFGSLNNWQTIARALAGDLQVVSLDLRNHGRSFHSAVHTYTAMTKDIADFLARHDLEKVAFLGHSMGGKVAMSFALAFPSVVERLVVVDIAPRAYRPRHDTILEALKTIRIGNIRDRESADRELSPMIPDGRVRQFLLTNLKRNPDGSYRWKMNLEVLMSNYNEMTKGIHADTMYNGPALFVRGGKSDYVRSTDLPHIKRLFPRFTHATIPEAGHWLHADRPQDFLSLVRAFLVTGRVEHR